jgi:ribonucleotide monophosphatase NagD (HAD superfamily)
MPPPGCRSADADPFIRVCALDGRIDFNPKWTIMVGDRLDSDIQFGKCGLSTLLILTGMLASSLSLITCQCVLIIWSSGITLEESLTESSQSIVPDYVTPSIGDLRAVVSNQCFKAVSVQWS